jgi:hypothetical protein
MGTELGDGVIVIKDSNTGKAIWVKILSYKPRGDRFDTVSVELGSLSSVG